MAQASAEKLEHTELAEKGKGGLGATKRAVGKYGRATFSKRKRNKAVTLEHQIMRGKRVTASESRTLAGDQSNQRSKREHEEERVNSIVKEGGSKEEREGKQAEPS